MWDGWVDGGGDGERDGAHAERGPGRARWRPAPGRRACGLGGGAGGHAALEICDDVRGRVAIEGGVGWTKISGDKMREGPTGHQVLASGSSIRGVDVAQVHFAHEPVDLGWVSGDQIIFWQTYVELAREAGKAELAVYAGEDMDAQAARGARR